MKPLLLRSHSVALAASPSAAADAVEWLRQLLLAARLTHLSNRLIQLLVLLSIGLLLAAAVDIARIYRTLPPTPVRRAWLYLGCLLAPAVAGFALFLALNSLEGAQHHEDWLVGLTLFASALFVFAVCLTSRYTAKDLVRIGELELAAYFDDLTGLYSRGQLLKLLDLACSRASLHISPLSVLLLDVDHFKLVNDRFGHPGGDTILEQLAWHLRESITAADYVGRYGGEEFLIVLPSTPAFAAHRIAERICSTVKEKRFLCGELPVAVSVSIGVATSFTFREAAAELIAQADGALYAAKGAGRNQVRSTAEHLDRTPAPIPQPPLATSPAETLSGELLP